MSKKRRKARREAQRKKIQKRFKAREAKGLSGLTGGPKGKGPFSRKGSTMSIYRSSQQQKIRDAARARNEKFKQTRVQTFGGKKTRFTKKEETRIKDAGYKVAGYSKARFKPTPKPKVDAVGRNELKTGGTKLAGDYTGSYTNRQLLPDGSHGFPKIGDVINTGGKSGKDFKYDGTSWKAVDASRGRTGYGGGEGTGKLRDTQNQNLAWNPNFLKKSIIPNAAETGKNYLNNFRDENAADETKGLNKFFKNIQTRDKLLDQSSLGRSGPLITASDLTDLRGIMPAQSSYFGIKPSESFGYPSQAEVDEAAGTTSGTTSGGLNIGGGGLNRLGRRSRGRTSRGIRIGGSVRRPTVQEEVLLPVEQPVQTASTTPTTTTGVNPNRLLEIQQQAYAQAYNPMLIGGYNPQFRFGAATPTIDYSTYFNY